VRANKTLGDTTSQPTGADERWERQAIRNNGISCTMQHFIFNSDFFVFFPPPVCSYLYANWYKMVKCN
jgi:hypothetical protein